MNYKDDKTTGAPPAVTISEDKQAAEYLANERTFLAWVRTSIAVNQGGYAGKNLPGFDPGLVVEL